MCLVEILHLLDEGLRGFEKKAACEKRRKRMILPAKGVDEIIGIDLCESIQGSPASIRVPW